MAKKLVFILILMSLFLLDACNKRIQNYTTDKSYTSDHAMVVTAHPLASDAGISILKEGGNAIDAAIAVHFALAVVHPRAGNIGGGGFMIYRTGQGQKYALDFREKAPKKAHKDMYLDTSGNVIPKLSTEGGLAVGVPGSVAGMYEAHKKFGKMKWSRLLREAIRYAARGFPITQREADRLNRFKDVFIKYNGKDIPFVKDSSWKKGDILVQPQLALTLKQIQKMGPDGFYKGGVAKALLKTIASHNGILSGKDLEQYSAVWRDPIQCTYRDSFNIISMPPPSSGGITLCQMLSMSEATEMGRMHREDALTKHFMIEVMRRAFADRAKYLGDMDFVPVDISALLDKRYLLRKISDFHPRHATPSDSILSEDIQLPESFETTHFSIVDPLGNAVSETTTLNSNYGSKVYVKEAGFFLNNEMDDFSAKPGVPNLYGLVGSKANAIAPGKRMLSSMTPTIVERNNKLFLVLGAPGGSTIITAVYQVIVNTTDFKMPLDSAVQAKRFHHQWKPDLVIYENGAFTLPTKEQLKQKGHKFLDRKYIALINAILVEPNGMLHGAADNRSDNDVEGY